MQIFISVHVPKTGGTSFRLMLQQFFGDGFCQDYDWEQRPQYMIDGIDGMSDEEIRTALTDVRCIHGHFNVKKYARLRDVEGIDPVFITWLRDPIERALSTYYFLRTLDTPEGQQPDWERRAKELTLSEFYTQTKYGRNRQYVQLRHLSPDEYSFFGVTEWYAESMDIFQRNFFPDAPVAEIPHKLQNTMRKGSIYEVSPDVRETLALSNEHDIRLYQYARGWVSGALSVGDGG